MARKCALNIRLLSVFVLFIAVLIVLIGFPAQAQQVGVSQASVISPAASAQVQASTSAQALPPSLLPGAGNAQRPPNRPPRRKLGVSVMGPNAPLFLPAVAYSTGDLYPTSVAVADVNGDGRPDLVVGNCVPSGQPGVCQHLVDAEGVVGVLLGNGDGTFQSEMTYDSGGADAYSVAIADVNGDGKLDLVVANCGPSGSGGCGSTAQGVVSVLLGNGDGTFRAAVTYDSGGLNTSSVAVADVNGDGTADVLVASGRDVYYNSTSGMLGVLLGNGDGTFQKAVTYLTGGVGSTSVVVVDVNRDSKLDLLIANGACKPNTNYGGCVGVLLGNGDGTFQPVVTYDSGGGETSSVAVADVNGDGKLDLLVTNWFCLSPNAVVVLLGNGDGTFQAAVTYGSGGETAWSIAVADVNGDGKPDLLVANQCAGNTPCTTDAKGFVGVLLNIGDGTFQPALKYYSGGVYAVFLVATDINGDGRPDIVVVNRGRSNGGRSVGILLNNSPSDTTSPVITISATPKVLWPPNEKMVPVIVSGTITDTGSGVNVRSATYAVKDEYGNVQPAGAISLGTDGSYSFTVWLQASRLGTDLDGRCYTITVRAEDYAGNGGSREVVVTVLHDQGN